MATTSTYAVNGNGHHAPQPTPTRDFVIHNARRSWIVKRGKVDLFLQLVDSENKAGARFHIARLEEGHAIFGIDVSERPYVKLVACPHPGAEVVSRLIDDVLVPGNGPAQAADLLERWIAVLTQAAACDIVPKQVSALQAGTIISPQTEIAVVADEPLIWVKHLKGGSQFMSHDEFLSGDEYFPLSKQGQAWLKVSAGATLSVSDWVTVRSEDSSWRWLKSFHSVVLTCLIVNRERKEAERQNKIGRQRSADAELVHRSLLGLASPVNAEVARNYTGSSTSGSPLLLACRKLGEISGIKFKEPAGAEESLDGKNAVDTIARVSGVRHRPVLLRSGWWRQDNGPLLVFQRKTNRPLALLPRGRGYEVYDPVESKTSRCEKSVWENLEPIGFSFYRPFPLKKLNGKDLLMFAFRSVKLDILTIVLMGVCGGLSSMAVPVVTALIFDDVIPSAEHQQLTHLISFLVVCALATAMFSLVRSFAVIRMEGRVDSVAQPAMWDRVLRLPAPFFRNFSSGDLAVRSLAINQIRQILTNSTLASILSGIFSVFSFGLLFYYSWKLALLATGLVGIAILFSAACAYVQLRYVRETTQAKGKISSMLLQFVNGIAKFRISGSESRAYSAWADVFTRQKHLYLKGRKAGNALAVFQSVFPILSLAIIFWLGTGVLGKTGTNTLSTGAFLAFLAAFTQLLTSTMQLSSSVTAILNVVPLYERALPIFHTLPEVDESQPDPGELKGGIEASHINFRYSSDGPPVLRDVSFSIRPGEFVAFTGPSGSGKSTLLRLLLGFENPESGRVSYDGQDITGIDIQAVRQQIGVVLQSGRLTSGPILENIIGSSRLTIDDAWEAARLAGLDADIQGMPMGMHTVVSDGGGGLSGGQRQRLMIARAIVKKPRILFFDEATSALDNHTQTIVSQGLNKMQSTRVVIAHRLSTIKNADRIFVFDRGSIVQCGSYDELLKQPGIFSELVRRQMV